MLFPPAASRFLVKSPPDLQRKISLLMSLAQDDRDSGAGAPLPPRLRNATGSGALGPLNLRMVRPGRGPSTTLLRILMTNACSFNCHYCPMRRDRAMPRTLLKPEELVRVFLGALSRGEVSAARHESYVRLREELEEAARLW